MLLVAALHVRQCEPHQEMRYASAQYSVLNLASSCRSYYVLLEASTKASTVHCDFVLLISASKAKQAMREAPSFFEQES